MKFRDLATGATFYFPPFYSWQSPGGPYVKTAARKYRDETQRYTLPFTNHRTGRAVKAEPITYQVGTINVSVCG
jgi:hypothetical protein